MALKIAVVSQKGGVGKSTLVRALAIEYARNDWSVKVADMDLKQKTATEWNCIRMENELTPNVAVEPFAKVNDVLKQDSQYELIIFDGAGQADAQTLAISKASDYIILPTGITRDDLMPQVKLAHELRRKGVDRNRVAFALSRVGASSGEQEAAIEFIEDAGYYVAGIIQERTSIGQCHDNGLAANETRYKSINTVIDTLIQNIGNKINQIEESYG
ncbi:MAG: ParA family protein [Saprospiraceae bacterium]